jgi:hypothetical protein
MDTLNNSIYGSGGKKSGNTPVRSVKVFQNWIVGKCTFPSVAKGRAFLTIVSMHNRLPEFPF